MNEELNMYRLFVHILVSTHCIVWRIWDRKAGEVRDNIMIFKGNEGVTNRQLDLKRVRCIGSLLRRDLR